MELAGGACDWLIEAIIFFREKRGGERRRNNHFMPVSTDNTIAKRLPKVALALRHLLRT